MKNMKIRIDHDENIWGGLGLVFSGWVKNTKNDRKTTDDWRLRSEGWGLKKTLKGWEKLTSEKKKLKTRLKLITRLKTEDKGLKKRLKNIERLKTDDKGLKKRLMNIERLKIEDWSLRIEEEIGEHRKNWRLKTED